MPTILDPLVSALKVDPHAERGILDAITVYAHGWAEANEPKDADEGGYYSVQPQWPGWRKMFNGVSFDLTKFLGAITARSPRLKGMVAAFGADLADDPEIV